MVMKFVNGYADDNQDDPDNDLELPGDEYDLNVGKSMIDDLDDRINRPFMEDIPSGVNVTSRFGHFRSITDDE